MKHRRSTAVLVLAILAAAGAGLAQTRPNPPLDAGKKQAIVDEITKLMDSDYVFPETARKLDERLRSRLKSGAYDAATGAREFAQAVARDILEVTKDRHTGFAYDPETTERIRRFESRKPEEVRQSREEQLAFGRRNNFAFRRAERMSGNVGYLEFRNFLPAEDGGATAVAALNFLAHCDALIIDLRRNGGGEPSMIQLISSYFFPESTHLNDIWIRSTGATENYWTLPFVPGPRMADVDLYVLTSGRTFSAAEEFTYNLKNLKRATIVGETTGGGAHPTSQHIVRDDFVLRVPFARSINPISGTNWEGTGVPPDVSVPEARAFDVAYRMALEKAAAKATDPRAKAECEWTLVEARAKAEPVSPDEATLRSYAGEYGERKVTFEEGRLYYQRTGPKGLLTPLTATLFALEGVDYFRLEFVVTDGKAAEVVGRYDNGTTDTSVRTK